MADWGGGAKGAAGGASAGAAVGSVVPGIGTAIGGIAGGLLGGLGGLFGGGGSSGGVSDEERKRLAGMSEDDRRRLQAMGARFAREGLDRQTTQGVAQNIFDLQRMARGQGPSIARLQAQEAMNRGLANQQAMLATAGPANQAMAARMAAQQGGALAGSVMGASAQARAQEALGARSMLGQALGQQGQLSLQDRSVRNQAMLQAMQMQSGQIGQMYDIQNGKAAQLGMGDRLLMGGLDLGSSWLDNAHQAQRS